MQRICRCCIAYEAGNELCIHNVRINEARPSNGRELELTLRQATVWLVRARLQVRSRRSLRLVVLSNMAPPARVHKDRWASARGYEPGVVSLFDLSLTIDLLSRAERDRLERPLREVVVQTAREQVLVAIMPIFLFQATKR